CPLMQNPSQARWRPSSSALVNAARLSAGTSHLVRAALGAAQAPSLPGATPLQNKPSRHSTEERQRVPAFRWPWTTLRQASGGRGMRGVTQSHPSSCFAVCTAHRSICAESSVTAPLQREVLSSPVQTLARLESVVPQHSFLRAAGSV